MHLTPNRVLRTFRYAMHFDGIDDYVDCGNNPSLNTTTEATVEAIFFSMNEPWLVKDSRFFSKGNRKLTTMLTFGCWHHPRIFFEIIVGVTCYSANYWINHYGKWWFITGTLKAGKWVKLYDSGVLKVTNNDCPISSLDISNTNLIIGMCSTEPHCYHYKGYIHTIRYYNRVLSDIEIRYNLDNPDNPIRDGLVLWLKSDPNYVKDIDNDGILEWIDLSGYKNHGKIYGAVLTKVIKDPISVRQPRRILSVVR